MTYDPYTIVPAVLVALVKEGKVMLGRRTNTAYMDGYYGLIGGHLEKGETLQEGAAREVFEEVGVKVNPKDLELFQVYQNQNEPDRQYIGFIFRTENWEGEFGPKEDKADLIKMFKLGDLPKNTIPYHAEAVKQIQGPKIDYIFTPPGAFKIDP